MTDDAPPPSLLRRLWRTFLRPFVAYLAAALAAVIAGGGLFILLALAREPSLATARGAALAALFVGSLFTVATGLIAFVATWTAHATRAGRPTSDLAFGAAVGPVLYALFLSNGTYDLPLALENWPEILILAIAGLAGGAVYWRLVRSSVKPA